MSAAPRFVLPAGGWQARDYQEPFFDAMENGTHRACCVWHRRSGKTHVMLHLLASKAAERRGTYRHVFPTLKQAREVVWDEFDNDGRPMLAAFPDFDNPGQGRFVVRKREDQMRLWLFNGSMIVWSGADEPDTSLRGGNAVGWVFDEFATSPKMQTVWRNVATPIVRLNGGFSVFVFTPRGKNHAHKLFNMAKKNEDWFCQKLSRHDTSRLATVTELRRFGWPESEIEQVKRAA